MGRVLAVRYRTVRSKAAALPYSAFRPLKSGAVPVTGVTAGRAPNPYRGDMPAILSSYRDAVAFRPERFNPVLLAAGAHMKAVLTCLEAGQYIPVHKPGVDMLLIVLEGNGQIAAGSAREIVQPGSVIFVPAGEDRGLKAENRLVALHVVSPPPTDKDHVEVMAKLKQGTWE